MYPMYDDRYESEFRKQEAAKRASEAAVLEAKAVEADASAAEWDCEGTDDCGCHCMYVRIAASFRERAEAAR